MSDAPQTPTKDVSTMKRERFLYLALGTVLAAIVVYFALRSSFFSSTVENENVKLKKELANINEKLTELKTAELYRQDQQQAKKSVLKEVDDRAKVIALSIDALKQEIDTWQNTTADLLRSDKGKSIAANQTLVLQFVGLQKTSRPSPDCATQLQSKLDILLVPIKNALQAENTVYTPSDELRTQIQAIAAEAAKAAETYRDHNQQLQAILAQAATAAPSNTPTLQDALAALEKSWADERARRTAAEAEKARLENAEKAAQAEAENLRIVAEAKREAERKIAQAKAEDISGAANKEVKGIEVETQRARDAAKAIEERKQREQQEAQLEREFERDLPEIRSLLRGCIEVGTTQPGHYATLEKSTVRGPLSLSAIRGKGALERTIPGQKKFHVLIGGSPNDRELGGFPRCTGGAQNFTDNQDTIQKAQDLLNKYGELMVKKKLLAE